MINSKPLDGLTSTVGKMPNNPPRAAFSVMQPGDRVGEESKQRKTCCEPRDETKTAEVQIACLTRLCLSSSCHSIESYKIVENLGAVCFMLRTEATVDRLD
jgi:hypothetical protein